ncbi:hypothetical protein ABH922_001237 [Rhodococcus sp. 27YEA15]|uniref:hypothetical protein n=1 Tax=Rhodococcus sp. 27YEA15 TaxID=3156259 RepID=UPI003C7A6154
MVGKFERGKDTVQELTESAADHVGTIAKIIAGAVRDVTREIGDWVSDGIEMREAAQRAAADDRAEARASSGETETARSGDTDTPTES